ncbi:exodeoxyribonuclease VII large subunit [Sphingobacterium sp. E70]|uniref:exodeoxyribonuclease VII large subunit n=1 Tax=Sphingobacterium sp. E70 TaxID=2853439 RepID=UPI00211C326E|nr:exodeoxyribonuclease VII large subunit [Sphingobacterium sp. E70]ULT28374.1 exodeoxyribonuclease VII large subunit [Sphingobacterium sp. E70]
MNKLNHYTHSGHCYPELVEKQDGKIVAEIRSTLWKADFTRINNNFLKIAQEPLREGITMLFQASISYDPMYGLSLRIVDIDPTFTLGNWRKRSWIALESLKKKAFTRLINPFRSQRFQKG